ncbi:MAG: T9SS type A sorting domain-containing protein [Flavobacteriales bacterium]|nr:T9SS type A sorting domain-containing protein [Flavobacteriales bacterium]
MSTAELMAQVPGVQWQTIKALGERPEGTTYTYNTGSFPVSYNASAQTLSTTVDPADSGIDWFNDVCLVRDANGDHVGYAVAGYSYIPNWGFTNAHCETYAVSGDPFLLGMETKEKRYGMITGTVALFDLDGVALWHHTYMGGLFFGIIQDRNGDLVVTGYGLSIAPWPNTPWAQQPLYYNPAVGQPLVELGDPNTPCDAQQGKMVVLKIDRSNGHVIWNHAYGSNPDPQLARNGRTFGYSLVETDPDGSGGYRVVGYRRAGTGDPALAQRPFMVDLDANGMLNWNVVMDEAYLGTLLPDAGFLESQAFHIARHPDPAQDRYAITGMRWQYDTGGQPISFSAYLLYFDGNGPTPTWFEDTGVNASEYGLAANAPCSANRVQFAVDGPNTSIIWPVLTDFTGGYGAQFNHEATGRVYRMDLNGDQLWPAPANLGPMRGYDLLMAARQRANGNVVISCTKSTQSTTPLQWSALSQDIQDCLNNTYTIDHDNNPNTPDEHNWPSAGLSEWGHWLSDSYMAELDLADGSVNWEGTWDADNVAGTTPTCDPDNYRQRQCSFQVVEADDEGLVVCGNTGHTWEDGFLIKFHGCESDPELYTAFHALYPYDPSNVYTLTATNTTWSTSMNVRGSVVIPAGKTLTINNGATISFADSRRVGYTTNLVVQPGGKLVVVQGATLTNIGPCGDGMWDGIMALGNTNLAQSPGNQATVELATGATITNAFVGVLAANADINDPIGSTATQRGARVICANAVFENNIHDVVLRPYSCGGGCANDFTVTKFWECDFLTTGPLNYADKTPKVHLHVSNYPRTWVRGCVFENSDTGINGADVAAWGVGIESFNTDLRVVDQNNGDPAMPRTPTFGTLQAGCLAANSNGKPVYVYNAYFGDCGHGLGIWGSANARVVGCDFKEPDLDMVGQGFGAPVYGTYLEGTSSILFEDNWFSAVPGTNTYPCVGSTFNNIGSTSNTYTNNRYDAFDCLNCAGIESAGTTIQGSNSGLQFRCNQYSSFVDNAYDIAFTGGNVTVSPQQGATFPIPDPAGNTFALNCTGEQHFYNDGGATGINIFTYHHHAPDPTVEVVPTCMSFPLSSSINSNTFQPYNGCAGPQNLMMASAGDQSAAAANAAGEYALLKAVYDDWSDGGDPDGLQDFVTDPANGSYAIRNQLMMVAPKVSDEVWKEVFERIGDMNPWHLAQALIANSPLEPPVMAMLEHSTLMPYYKQLVANEQGGMSMQMIKQSELSYWRMQQTRSLQAYTSRAYEEVPTVTYAEAIALHQQYPVEGSAEQIMLLHLANNDLAGARACVNAALAVDHTAWWEVQDLYLYQLENGLDMEALDPGQEAQLTAIAAGSGPGSSNAKAWLATAAAGRPAANVVLPNMTRSLQHMPQAGAQMTEPEYLEIFPNPSQGAAFITYTLPEGLGAAELQVYDARGRIIWQKRPERSSGITELPSDLAPGLYQAVLSSTGVLVGSAKFTVIR